MIVIVFAVLFAMLVFVSIVGCASAKTIYVPTDYSSIQEAIDAASLGDTVFVWNGTYYEDGGVSITKKRITLQGEDANTTTINGKWTADKVVNVTGNYVNVNGFMVAGSTLSGHGIYVEGDNCIISDNNIVDGRYGISLSGSNSSTVAHNNASTRYYGIYLSSSSDCVVSDNIANWSIGGIYLYYSSNCVLENNIAIAHYDSGIYLEYSSNCVLENNIANSNGGMFDGGIYLYYSSNCVLENNIANSNDGCGICLDYSSNCVLENNIANLNGGGIWLYGSDYSVVENNNANSNECAGIGLSSSSNCNITNNVADSNNKGIRLLGPTSTNNNITENNISNNTGYGMYLDYSPDNEIYHNNFINNDEQAYDHHGFNNWDKGPIIGGNYWSDHVCHGNPSDGTEPYTGIDTDAVAVDNYPFEDPDGWVTPPQKPAVTVSTDKAVYNPGDTMIVTLSFKNPTTESIDTYFIWYFGLPDYGYWKQILVTPFTLPPNFDQSYNMSIPIGNWGAVGFDATWYAALLETAAPYETISEDTAEWKYVPTAKTQEGKVVPEAIAEEITKEIEGVELSS